MSDDNVVPFRDPTAGPAPTHIKLTIPVGSLVSSAGDWIVVQYGPDLLQCFNRFDGSVMPHDMLAELVNRDRAIVPEQRPVALVDKAGAPLSGIKAVTLAKPGPALLDEVSRTKGKANGQV